MASIESGYGHSLDRAIADDTRGRWTLTAADEAAVGRNRALDLGSGKAYGCGDRKEEDRNEAHDDRGLRAGTLK